MRATWPPTCARGWRRGTVRFYPRAALRYESHLAPPPHLVGLRVAALDALLGDGEHEAVRRSSSSAPSRCRRRCRTRRCVRTASRSRSASCSTSTRRRTISSQPATSASTRSRTAGSSRSAAACSTSTRRPRTAPCASTSSATRSSRCAGSRRSRSARSAMRTWSRSRPPPSWRSEHRELAEIAALEDAAQRPDIAELLPVKDFHAMLDLVPGRGRARRCRGGDRARARRPLAGRLRGVPRRRRASSLRRAQRRSRPPSPSARRSTSPSIDQDQPHQFRAQAADVAARRCKDAEPELEKLVRSGYRTVVAFARKGEGERAAYNLGRLKVRWVDGDRAERRRSRVRRGAPARRLHRAGLPARGDPRAPPLPPPPGDALRRSAAGRRRGALRSFTDLRTGDIVVHEDHGLARFAGFDTKTVAGVTRDYLELEYDGSDKVFMPVDQLAKISRYVGAGGAHPPLSKLGGKRWETTQGARPPRRAGDGGRAAQPLRRAQAPRRAMPSRPTPTGCASSRTPFPTARRPTSARRSSRSSSTWRRRGRWTG